ncbi:uncharacterized protein LOC136072054 isoform X6 [Hydra vulgaris]|uniref:Uncharacterized protein LOC136072054 isoform X6 n=1 Tax=Hydra vulgaris TaxID=6087 RepID=A0ABM4DNP8_HYDVU
MAYYLGFEDAFRKMRRSTSSATSLSNNGMNLNKLEKSWFSAAAECDILKLKQYYGNDKDLLNKKDIFTGLLCIGLPRKEILICFCGFLNKKLTSI